VKVRGSKLSKVKVAKLAKPTISTNSSAMPKKRVKVSKNLENVWDKYAVFKQQLGIEESDSRPSGSVVVKWTRNKYSSKVKKRPTENDETAKRIFSARDRAPKQEPMSSNLVSKPKIYKMKPKSRNGYLLKSSTLTK
jgi:hypothetical protein